MTKCPGTWLTAAACGRGPGYSVSAFIETSEERIVVDQIPEPVVHFFEADVFTVEGLAEEVLSEGIYVVGANYPEYDVDPRSGRFLMIKTEQAAGEAEIVVVVNWVEELRRRMGN